jgi:3-oxoacyl-[acyl-carrier protein] reductase
MWSVRCDLNAGQRQEEANMDLGIKGRVALVTASSKGLGKASAAALALEGAKVVICARGQEVLQEAEAEIRASGGDVHAIVADVTDPATPAQLVAETIEHFGGLDILVPNAGGPPHGGALEITDEQIDAAINANLATSIRLIRHALPWMREQGWGRVCCIASYSVKQPMPSLALSNLARTGLWAWAKTAAADLFPEGITLNLACPGPHATNRRIPQDVYLDALGNADDFGRVVAFLCSASAAFLSGVAINVDGAAVRGLL